jgi:23S rRNA pseudouridine1911/1915/1917 synthase
VPGETHQILEVEPSGVGERLDRYLVQRYPELSRSRIQALIEQGEVTVGAKAAKASQLLKAGEEIGLHIPPPERLEVLPENLPLQIVYQDSDILVLDKSAEMVVHLGAGLESGTLVNALLHHCRDLSGIGGKERPGIVHRLDKGTSGLLVVAKNDAAHRHLSAQFKDRQVEKIYYAFVWGRPKKASGKIELALGRSQKNRKKIATRGSRLRPALTNYQTVKSWGAISLLELKPETGRTHQLRVHLAEIGHPIVGDRVYGGGRTMAEPAMRQMLAAMKYQLLHAGKLSFLHPKSGKRVSFEAPLREEMQAFKTHLEKAAP